ncbi:glycosyltransferase [Yinghuangia sp. YIM S09857]|uniref:glycosyltransferase n=1 Tax=Yinghuangia sp. YIM S09857 TaxID=3436929 RepID=UPI003F52BA0A
MSVITAVHDQAIPFLPQAAASLAQQDVPIDWIVCYDGERLPAALVEMTRHCREFLPDLLLVASGRSAGPSTARTVALSRVRAPWTAVLDADDVWLPGGLDRLVATARATNSAWCAGLTVDLHEEGSRQEFPDYLPTGTVAAGTVFDVYQRLGFLPFHGCAVVWATPVLWEMGGWPALPSNEDSGLVLAATERFDGVYQGESPVYGYRKHPGQTTAALRYADREAIATDHNHAWISALRGTGTRCGACR